MLEGRQQVENEGRYPSRWTGRLSTLVLLLALALLVLTGRHTTERAQPTPVTSVPAATPTPTSAPSPLPSTPTPTATPTASPTATPTWTPTPTPTATPAPSVRLNEGQRLQGDGDYAAARRVFAELLLAAPGGDEAPEARFRLAQCYLLDGLPLEAAAGFQAFLDGYPQDPRRSQAFFLLGEAWSGAGAWDKAIAAYQAYLDAADEPLADVVHERMANAHRNAGRADQALAAYAAALAASPDTATSSRLRTAMAQVYFLRGDYEQALAQYQALQELATTPTQRAEAELRQAEVLRVAGRAEEAEPPLRAAMDAEPRSAYAYEALKALLDMGLAVDDYLRGVIDYHNGAYWPALAAFQRYLAGEPEKHQAEAHDYIARTYLALELPDLALAEWDRLIKEFPQSELWGEAWLAQARALRQSGQTDAARELLHRFAEENPGHPQAAEALALAAQWAERAGAYLTAAEEYAALQQRYPEARRAGEALFQAALNRYRLGEVKEAAALWQRLWEEYPWYRPQSACFWLGKSLLAAGQRAAAAEAWQSLLETAAESYYGSRAMALARTAGLELMSDAAPDTAAQTQAAAEEWLRGWLPADETLDPRTLPAAVEEDPAYRRGVALLALGLRTEALATWEGVKNRWYDDPQAMYALALRFRDLGAYRLSILCAARLLDLSPLAQRAAAPRFLQELAYPTYFADLVEMEAAAQGLDPLLVYAIIRQESLFEPVARSPAAAQGLMQVIPSTGEWVAQHMGWPNYRSEHIYRPYINVKFGVYYLASILQGGERNLMTALVGYNAGPGNARYWRALVGDDDDLFVETITTSEPQRYVQGVLQQYAVYRRLYGGRGNGGTE